MNDSVATSPTAARYGNGNEDVANGLIAVTEQNWERTVGVFKACTPEVPALKLLVLKGLAWANILPLTLLIPTMSSPNLTNFPK